MHGQAEELRSQAQAHSPAQGCDEQFVSANRPCGELTEANLDVLERFTRGSSQQPARNDFNGSPRQSGKVDDLLTLSLNLRSRAEEWNIRPEEIHIQELIGEGDCAAVYKARWRGMDTVVKKLKTEREYLNSTLSASAAKADLVNEISILSHLRHPNLVLFLGACIGEEVEGVGGGLILLKEYMEGGNLESFFAMKSSKAGKIWKPCTEKVLAWSQDLGQALCFLHNCSPKIIHRDLKPANVLLGSEGRLKIGDFGLSSVLRGGEHGQEAYKMTGKTGTLRYMAPEVLDIDEEGDSVYDEKVDIYSAAMIIWFMAIGERPYGDLDGEVVSYGARQGLRPDLKGVRKRSHVLAQAVQACWSANPGDRWSAQKLVDEIKGAKMEVKQKAFSSKSIKGKVRRVKSWFSSAALRILHAGSGAGKGPVAEPDRPQHPVAVAVGVPEDKSQITFREGVHGIFENIPGTQSPEGSVPSSASDLSVQSTEQDLDFTTHTYCATLDRRNSPSSMSPRRNSLSFEERKASI